MSLPYDDGDDAMECNFQFLIDDIATGLVPDLTADVFESSEMDDLPRWEDLTDEEKAEDMRIDAIAEERFNERMMHRNLEISYAEATVPPVQLVSQDGIRVLKFTAGDQEYDDNGWYSDQFCSSIGEAYNFEGVFEDLGEISFLVHLYHAKQRRHLNYAGLFKTFGQFYFNNICKVLRNGAVVLHDPTCPERDFPFYYWQHDLQSWFQNNQMMVKSTGWNLRWQQEVSQVMNSSQYIVPTEIFRHAIIDTYTVNYRDTLLRSGGTSFNALCETEVLMNMLNSTGMMSNNKPVGDIGATTRIRTELPAIVITRHEIKIEIKDIIFFE